MMRTECDEKCGVLGIEMKSLECAKLTPFVRFYADVTWLL